MIENRKIRNFTSSSSSSWKRPFYILCVLLYINLLKALPMKNSPVYDGTVHVIKRETLAEQQAREVAHHEQALLHQKLREAKCHKKARQKQASRESADHIRVKEQQRQREVEEHRKAQEEQRQREAAEHATQQTTYGASSSPTTSIDNPKKINFQWIWNSILRPGCKVYFGVSFCVKDNSVKYHQVSMNEQEQEKYVKHEVQAPQIPSEMTSATETESTSPGESQVTPPKIQPYGQDHTSSTLHQPNHEDESSSSYDSPQSSTSDQPIQDNKSDSSSHQQQNEPANSYAATTTQASGQFDPPANAKGVIELGYGKLHEVEGAEKMKKAIREGLESVLPGDDSAVSFAYASAAGETAMGKDMPTEANQASDKVQKLGTLAQEFGPFRMSRHMLQLLNYNEDQIHKMNQLDFESIKLAAEAFGKGLERYGPRGFMVFHRLGMTGYTQFLENKLSDTAKKDLEDFIHKYQSLQVTIKKECMTGNHVPYLDTNAALKQTKGTGPIETAL